MVAFRFHVFSGTGNSRHLARAIAARLVEGAIATEIREVSAAEIARARGSREGLPPRGEGDLDVFLFPVYAMSLPRLMDRYMRSLGDVPSGGPRPRAAILSTNGRISAKWRDGHEGQALDQAERILRRLGWEVVYRDSLDYPQGIATLLPIQDEERQAAIMALAAPRIAAVAEDLAAGRIWKRPCRLWALLVGWPFGWLYRLIGRRAWGMLFAADGSCDGCGLCAARCPAGAIRMRGRAPALPDWSYACEGCERCINLCPKKAIQTSLLRLAIVVALCVLVKVDFLRPILAEALGSWPATAFAALWASSSFALSLILAFALLRLADLGLALLSRVPGLRPILAFGWTRWTRRYADPSRKA
jgi:ferredoxin